MATSKTVSVLLRIIYQNITEQTDVCSIMYFHNIEYFLPALYLKSNVKYTVQSNDLLEHIVSYWMHQFSGC